MKTSYKKISINYLSDTLGITQQHAEILYRRAYQQSLYRLKKIDKIIGVNVSHEVFSAITKTGPTIFNININPLGVISKTALSGLEVVNKQFDAMGNKYKEVKKLLDDLNKGKIKYSTFLAGIRRFKRSKKYLEEDS